MNVFDVKMIILATSIENINTYSIRIQCFRTMGQNDEIVHYWLKLQTLPTKIHYNFSLYIVNLSNHAAIFTSVNIVARKFNNRWK